MTHKDFDRADVTSGNGYSRYNCITEDQFEEFLRLLDEPVPSTAKFDRLFSRRSRFYDHDRGNSE